MGVSWNRDDDPIAPARGIALGSVVGLVMWSIICGVVLFFFLNGWSFR
jgi:hypothetical protein